MKNDIDDTTDEYASDLKKKIEEAKLEKEAKLKEEALLGEEAYASKIDEGQSPIETEEDSLERLRDMKAGFEQQEQVIDDSDLETVEFEVGPEEQEDEDLDKTKVVTAPITSDEVIDIEESSSDESNVKDKKKKKKSELSAKDKKRNKIITISIISVLVLALVGGGIATYKIFGGTKEDTTAEKTKEKTKKKEDKKDDKKEDASINDAQRAALEGQIASNSTSIATLEKEIGSLRSQIEGITTQITKAESYENNINYLNTGLPALQKKLLEPDSEANNHQTIKEEISKSLDSMQCSSIIDATNSASSAQAAIEGCKSVTGTFITQDFPGYSTSTLPQLKTDLRSNITGFENTIAAKTGKINELKQDSANKQQELNALK